MRGGHAAGVPAVAVSMDGSRIATASFDTTVKLFDTSSGQLVRTIVAHDVAARAVAFVPGSGYLVSGGFDGVGRIWDPADGSLLFTLSGHGGAVSSVAVSPDGARVATGSADGTIKVWNAADGSLVGTLSGHAGWIYTVAFSPDGTLLASGGEDGTIRLWRVSDGVPVLAITGHGSSVLAVAFSPDGALLASGSTDDTVRLWRVSDGAPLATFTDQTLYIYGVCFSPDGEHLASGAGDGTLVIRRVSDGVIEQNVLVYRGVLSLAYSPAGNVLYAGADDGTVSALNPSDGSLIADITGHWGSVNAIALSGDGSVGVSSGDDGTVVVHNMATGDVSGKIAAHAALITDVALTQDGAVICTTSDDLTAALWATADGSKLHDLTGHTDTVLCAAFSGNGTMVATGGSDSMIHLWRVSDGSLIGTFMGHTGAVRDLRFSPDDTLLASCGADGTVRMWRVSDQTQIWQAYVGTTTVLSIAYSPDGSKLASGAAQYGDSTLRLWRVSDGTLLQSATQASATIQSLSFSPDGLLIVTGGQDASVGRLQFWHAGNLGLLQTFDQETGTCLGSLGVMSVAFTPDNHSVFYSRYDGTVVLASNPFWPLPTTLSVPDITGQVAEMITLRAVLQVSLSGGAIMGKRIEFFVEGTPAGSGVTDGSGTATCDYRIPADMAVGSHALFASFAGDEAYRASEGSANLTVTTANTSIIVENVAGILGDPVVLGARLIRTTDDGVLPGRILRFQVEGVDAGTAVTGEDGTATLNYAIPIGAGSGERLITVNFAGDARHKECVAYGTLAALKRPTDTTVLNASAQIGQLIELMAQVTFRGTGVAGLTVQFRVDGTDLGSAVTNESGTAATGYYVPEGAGAGQRVIEASFEGTAVYAPSSSVGTLNVQVTGTFVYVPTLSRTAAAGTATVLRAYLYRSTDRGGIAGRPVQFFVEGALTDTTLTDSDGRATGYYTVPTGAGSADLTVRAVFPGDSTYMASEGTGVLKLTVTKIATHMWVLPRLGLRGSATYLRGYLRRVTDFAGLPGKPVSASVDGTFVGSATTDSNGRASVFYRIPDEMEAGYHTISMSFAGDELYHGSTGSADMLIF